MTQRMPEWLGQRARLTPHRLALIAGDEQLDFAQLDRAVEARAAALQELGARPGDRVALLMRNGQAFVELVHAAPRLGAQLVLLNTRLTPRELGWQVDDAEPRLLLHDDANAETATAVGREHRALRLAAVAAPAQAARPNSTSAAKIEVPSGFQLGVPSAARTNVLAPRLGPPPSIDLAEVHTIIYTSGTTGRPKGAMLTYGNHWWSAIGSALNLGLHEDDRWLACLPLFHVGGLAILLRSAIYGIGTIVHESFDPAAVNRAIDTQGVTIVSVVAAMLRRMLDERGQLPYPPTLRCALLGGGPAPRPLLEQAAARGVPVVQTYGLTEAASQVATLAPEEALRKLGSAGKPLLPTELRIERDGQEAPAGEVGEIVVRGPTVTPGYASRPDETAAAIRNGWLHTGDLGHLDDEGYLYLVDRRGDLIVSGGENVYPAEVEAVLLAHPAVAEAGVVGVPDERWGWAVLAVVKLRPNAVVSPEDLRDFCRDRLAGYKVPARVRLVEALPRNAAGKLLRRELRETESQ